MLKLLTIAAFCLILNTDNSQESREQILFCRNKLSASYPAGQRKQMEAIRLGTTIIDSIITFLFDRSAIIELTARTRSASRLCVMPGEYGRSHFLAIPSRPISQGMRVLVVRTDTPASSA